MLKIHVLETFEIETFGIEKIGKKSKKPEVATKIIIKVFRKSNKVVNGEFNAVRSL